MDHNEPEPSLAINPTDSKIYPKSIYPDIKSLITLFFIYILNTIIIAIPAGILLYGLKVYQLDSPIVKSLVNLMLYVIIALITIRSAFKGSKREHKQLLKIKFNKIQGWLVPVIMIGTLALIIPLEQISSWIPMSKSVQEFFETAFKKDIFSIITMVIAAPILEEILCRGIILRGLLKKYSPYNAILISAIFFGLMHLNPWQALPASLGGLFLGWVYYRTQSVIPGMIIHATMNGAGALLLFLPGHDQNLSSLMGLPYYLIGLLVSIIVFAAVCISINR